MGEHVTLDRRHPDALRQAVLIDLMDLDNLPLLLADDRMPEAQEQNRRFKEDFWLLDDLGWKREDSRESFTLRLDHASLWRAVDRFRRSAEEGFVGFTDALALEPDPWDTPAQDRAGRAALREHIDIELDVRLACDAVLSQLGEGQ